jgi:hypothetical protein
MTMYLPIICPVQTSQGHEDFEASSSPGNSLSNAINISLGLTLCIAATAYLRMRWG